MAFDPIIKRARYTVTGVPAATMKIVATAVMASVKARMLRGQTVTDVGAKPLSSKRAKGRWSYGYAKGQRHPPAIRNWKYSGFLMDQLQVLEASNNQAKIGFVEGVHPGPYGSAMRRAARKSTLVSQIVAVNQRRERQFGVSPKDAEVYLSALRANGVLNAIVVAKQV